MQPPPPPRPLTPLQIQADEIAFQVRPMIMKAAGRAGVVAAFTFAGICIVLGVVVWVAEHILSPV
jgi:hypothetical protein